MSFDTSFDRLISNEGGYVNNPADPGGETKFGICKRSYPQLDIANLTREQAKEIYLRDFWQRGSLDQLDPAIAFQLFDIAVNCGIETSVRMLQRAVNVADDGHIGPVTLERINMLPVSVIVMRLVAERLDYWRKLSTWPAFGAGWAARAAKDLRFATEDIS